MRIIPEALPACGDPHRGDFPAGRRGLFLHRGRGRAATCLRGGRHDDRLEDPADHRSLSVRSCACPARRAGPRGRAARAFAHRFEEAGTYLVRVSDYQKDGGKDHFYRIKVGDFRCGRVGLSTRRATRRDGDGGAPRTQPGRRQVLDPRRALVDGLDDRVMLRPDTERRARAFNSSQAGAGRSSGGRGVRRQHGGRNGPAGDGSRDHQRTAEGPTPTTSASERRRMS